MHLTPERRERLFDFLARPETAWTDLGLCYPCEDHSGRPYLLAQTNEVVETCPTVRGLETPIASRRIMLGSETVSCVTKSGIIVTSSPIFVHHYTEVRLKIFSGSGHAVLTTGKAHQANFEAVELRVGTTLIIPPGTLYGLHSEGMIMQGEIDYLPGLAPLGHPFRDELILDITTQDVLAAMERQQ